MALIQHNTLQDNAANQIITAAVGFTGTSQARNTNAMRIAGSGGSYPYGLDFDIGSGDHVFLGGTINLLQNFPWSLSIRVNREFGSIEHTICGEYQLLAGSGNTKISFLNDAGMTITMVSDGADVIDVDLSAYMSRAAWYTIGITNDGTETGTPYTYLVNGVQRATTRSHGEAMVIDTLGLGSGAVDSFLWDGGLSDFRIYDTQLNAASMLAIHQEGAATGFNHNIRNLLYGGS